MGATTNPPAGGVLGQPRPLPAPSITETRDASGGLLSPATTTTPGQAVPFGQAIPFGQPVPLGQPFPTGQPYPAGQPYPVGQPIPVGQPYPVGQPFQPGQPYPVGQPVPIGQPYPFGQSTPAGQPVPGQPFPVGQPVPIGQPVPVGPGASTGTGLVPRPSVFPGLARPTPDLDSPLYGGPTPYGGPAPYGGPTPLPTVGALGVLTGPSRLQIEAEMLMWWIRGAQLPALVTTSSPQYNGIIGQGDTRVLYGDSSQGQTLHTGGRFGATYWLGDDRKWGVDGDVFFLNNRGSSDLFTSDAYGGVLARPFNNLNQTIPFSELVASPGLALGAVGVATNSEMWGAQANIKRRLSTCGCGPSWDIFAGFRFLSFTEGLGITETFARTPGSPTNVGDPGVIFGSATDQFRTVNHFYGAQVGFSREVQKGRWFLSTKASLAMGTVFQMAQINGAQSLVYANGTTATYPGGLLALPGANIGTYEQRQFGVMPEVGLKVGYNISSHWRASVGYNFMYLNSVLRPGNQVDTGLDVTKIPNFPLPGTIPALTTVQPQPRLFTTDIFAQGISFSLQYTW